MANQSTRNVRAKYSYEQWSPEEVKELLRLLIEEVKNGQQLDNGYYRKETITGIVLPQLNAKFGNNKEYKHVKNKLRVLRQKLEQVEQISSNASGFDWDPVTQRFIALDEVWEEIKKAHPNAPSYRDKVFEDYDDLKMVFGQNFALGKDAGNIGPLGVNESVGQSLNDQELDEEIVVMEAKDITFIATQPEGSLPTSNSQAPHSTQAPPPPQATSSSSASRKKHKATENSSSRATIPSSLDDIAEGMSVVGNALQSLTTELHSIQHRYKEWKDTINSTPGLTDDMKWKALELSTTQEMKNTFISMSYEERQRWLNSKLGGS